MHNTYPKHDRSASVLVMRRLGCGAMEPGDLSPAARRGFTLLELIVTTFLLAAVLAIFAPLMALINAEHKAALKRQLAVEEACKLLEHISAQPWDTINKESLDMLTVSDSCAAALADHHLEVLVEEQPEPLDAKRVSVVLDWQNKAGQRVSPVRLTTWFYRSREGTD